MREGSPYWITVQSWAEEWSPPVNRPEDVRMSAAPDCAGDLPEPLEFGERLRKNRRQLHYPAANLV